MPALPAPVETLPRHAPRRASQAAPAGAGMTAWPTAARAIAEAPLASLGGLKERRFTAWRGRSGKRHVVSVFALDEEAALAFTDAVLIAVTQMGDILALRDIGGFGDDSSDAIRLRLWRDAMRTAGARELHVHLLADTAAARQDILRDLAPTASAELH